MQDSYCRGDASSHRKSQAATKKKKAIIQRSRSKQDCFTKFLKAQKEAFNT